MLSVEIDGVDAGDTGVEDAALDGVVEVVLVPHVGRQMSRPSLRKLVDDVR